MHLAPTPVSRRVGGPGCEKSLFTSAIIPQPSAHHKPVAPIADHGGARLWQKDYGAGPGRNGPHLAVAGAGYTPSRRECRGARGIWYGAGT